jgi:hypothetical protein
MVNAMPNDLEVQFQGAIQAGNRAEAWSKYELAWKANTKISMTHDIFESLFVDGSVANQAIALISQDANLRLYFARFVARFPSIDLHDSDVRRVYAAVVDGKTMIQQWTQQLRQSLSADKKAHLAKGFIEALIEQHGRSWMRAKLPSIWGQYDLIEEEKEAILLTLSDRRVLTPELLHSLGPEAVNLALSLRHRLPGYLFENHAFVPTIGGTSSSEEVRRRIALLFQEIVLNADFRDAGIPLPNHPAEPIGQRIEHIVDVLRHGFPFSRRETEEFVRALASHRSHHLTPPANLSFPLIRLLHLQLILSSPSLASALVSPEKFLLPDILLYVLGQKGIFYTPEIRIDSATDRRWRARLAETMAEAVSVIFIEDAVAMDLSTLSRIPESNKMPTPDFRAQTLDNSPIVFETKGSTNWETHRRQRKEAKEQLHKPLDDGDGESNSDISWDLGGQAFACCFFAAEQGNRRSSLFHVADPPFPFEDVFHEGWQDSARRHHYAAVLEACGQYELADFILGRRRREGPRPGDERIDDSEGPEGLACVGRYDALDLMARRLNHPFPERFKGVRVFRGLDQTLYRSLTNGNIPGDSSQRDANENPDSIGIRRTSSGIIPGQEDRASGVYSRLSDGAVMAVVVE